MKCAECNLWWADEADGPCSCHADPNWPAPCEYEDYEEDEKHGRFNPLYALHAQEDYEERMQEILAMEMAQCVKAFDFLPLEQDEALLRNILYSGVWGKYAFLQSKRKETKQ